MATVFVLIPVQLSNRPDNSLPPGSAGTPENPIQLPPEIWPTPPGGDRPDNELPIYVPIYPDNSLPGRQPGVDNDLPGGGLGGDRPDNTLPGGGSGTKPTPPGQGSSGRPDNTLPGSGGGGQVTPPIGPIYVPIYPPTDGNPPAQPKGRR